MPCKQYPELENLEEDDDDRNKRVLEK